MTTKPLLRGHFHQAAFFVTLGATLMLIFKSASHGHILPILIYSIGVLTMFGVSALYHRPVWSPQKRQLMRRLDHAAIYIMIAGSFTPICLLAMTKEAGQNLLFWIWLTAIIGISQSIFWARAPKWLSAILYIAMGWFIVPYLSVLSDSLGQTHLILLIIGGLTYTVGAVIYATKKPKLWPSVFGYHEFFHILVIIGAIFHFIIIDSLA